MDDAPPYWTNPYEDEFQVTVVSCRKTGSLYEIGIKEKAAKAAGGGQAGDKGRLLIENNELPFSDTAVVDGVVTLIANASVKEGSIGQLNIDMNWRKSSMKNHTAEHIFMSTMIRLNPKLKLGYIWIDGEKGIVDLMGPQVNFEDLIAGEKEVQKIASQNLPVVSEVVVAKDLPEEVRAREGITNKHEELRVISIGDIDKSACAGIHVTNTGEIGPFKVTDFKPVVGGMRVEFVTGFEATSKLSGVFNQALERKHTYPFEMEQLGAILDRAKESALEQAAMVDKITELLVANPNPIDMSGVSLVHQHLPGFNSKQLKILAKQIKMDPPSAVFLFAPSDRPTLLLWTNGLPKDAAEYISKIVTNLGGSGGGSKEVYTGGFSKVDDPKLLYEQLVEKLKEELE